MVLCEYFVRVGWGGMSGCGGQTLDALAVPVRPLTSDFTFVFTVVLSLTQSGCDRDLPVVS